MRYLLQVLTWLGRSRGPVLVFIYLGVLISFVGLFADLLGFSSGRPRVWGWRQAGVFGLGVALILIGLLLLPRDGLAARRDRAWAWVRRQWARALARRTALLVAALLAVILLGAGTARFLRSYNGLPYLHVFDEPQTANTALQMMKNGSLNPQFFNYGSLLIYANLGVDVAHYAYKMTRQDELDALRSLDQLEIGPWGPWPATGDNRWYVSHPSFYLWNRWLTAILGTGIVALTFVLATRVANVWAGLIAAAFLAGLRHHVLHSSMITTDVPASFFALLSLVLSLAYLEQRKLGWILGAAGLAGLAMGVKYNSVYVMLIPLAIAALQAWNHPGRRRLWLLPAIPLVTGGAFLLVSPFALIEFPTFLRQAFFEVYHYTVAGNGVASVEPGLQHTFFQIAHVILNIQFLGLILTLIGLPLLLKTPAGRWALVLGALSLLLASRTLSSYQRNLVILYPLVAVAIGCASATIAQWLWQATENRRWAWAARGLATILIAGLGLWHIGGTIQEARQIQQTQETRSAAIADVNELIAQYPLDTSTIGVASELQIHPLDLRRIDQANLYALAPAQQLVCAQDQYGLLVLPADPAQAQVRHYLETLDPARIWYRKPQPGMVTAERPLVNPAIAVVLPRAGAGAPAGCESAIALADLVASADFPIRAHHDRPALVMRSSGTVTTPFYTLQPGRYQARVEASGSPAFAIYPDLTITVLNRDGSAAVTRPVSQTVTLGAAFAATTVAFELREPAQVAIEVLYANDAFDRGQNQDRNAYIAAVALLPEPDRSAVTHPGAAAATAPPLPEAADPATAPPCASELTLLPANQVTAEHATLLSTRRWLLSMRSSLETAPCRMPAGQYGLRWLGQGTREPALVRATVQVFDQPGSPPRMARSRVLLMVREQLEWYEIMALDREAVVSLRLEWLDGAAYPGLELRSMQIVPTVEVRVHDPLTVREAIEQIWPRFGRAAESWQ